MINQLRAVLLLLIISTCVIGASAQNAYDNIWFDRLTVDDGLAQSAVHCIEKDKYGYVWMGTRGGLSRYDGYGFVNFMRDPDDSTTISNSAVYSILEDDANLWVGTSSGLNLYDRASEAFIRFTDPSLDKNNIHLISKLNSDTLLLGTQNGTFFFSKSVFNLVKSPIADSLTASIIFSRTEGDDTDIFGTENGLIIRKGTSHHAIDLGAAIHALYIDKNGWIWAGGSPKSLFKISPDFSTINKLKVSDGSYYVTDIIGDSSDSLIVAGGSLDIYDLQGNLVKQYKHNPDRSNSLSRDNILDVFLDEEGVIWAGTNGYGANRFDPNISRLQLVNNSTSPNFNLAAEYVTSVFTSNDNDILIGTSSGLNLYNVSSNSMSLIDPREVGVIHDSRSRIFVLSSIHDVKVYDVNSLRKTREFIVENMRGPRTAFATDSDLWIGAQAGLIRYNLRTGDEQIFIEKPQDFSAQTEDWITALAWMDSKFIVGTSQGVRLFDPSDPGNTIRVPALQSLDGMYVKCVTVSNQGVVWIGTWGDGLFRWDPRDDSLEQFSRANGLPDDVVYGILEDHEGLLWLSSNNGLTRYHTQYGYFFRIGMEYGLQSAEFNTGAYFSSASDIMYFGGVKGLNYFHPSAFKRNENVPETIVTGIYINNELQTGAQLDPENPRPVMELQSLELPYKDNMLRIDLLSTNQTHSEHNTYAYYLENLDDDYRYVRDIRYANYSSLPPGEYTFKAKSANNDGIWDDTPIEIKVTVNPPYWQTWWFRSLIIVLILIGAFLAYRSRIRYLKRNQVLLRKLVKERTQELEETIQSLKDTQKQLIYSEKMASLGILSAGIGHEINNPLNFIKNGASAMEEELKRHEFDKPEVIKPFLEIINSGVQRATNIVRSLSHFSRQGERNDEPCDIHEILDNCIVILQNKIKSKVEVEKDLDPAVQSVPGNEGKLHQAFLNIISNAIQSIDKTGSITIKTQENKRQVSVAISDTGSGIEEADISKLGEPFFTTKAPGDGVGLGLFITYAIIEEHRGRITVDTEVGTGTTFTIFLNK